MNIGIDIDDTISETFETLLPYSQKYTIESLNKEPIKQLKSDAVTHTYIEDINNWNEKEALKFWIKYYIKILEEVNIKKFASEVINKIREQGHKVYIITARPDVKLVNIKEITRKWLEENDVQYDELIINASDKAKIVKEKEIDIFIDDSLNNCKSIAENTSAKVYMMTSRVNEAHDNEKIRRVFSWPEIYDLISREEK